MANGISKDTFRGMDTDSKLGVLFDYSHDNYHSIEGMKTSIEALKKRPFVDKCLSFAGGAIGGFLAALGLKWGG
jgi:hypothetical protein